MGEPVKEEKRMSERFPYQRTMQYMAMGDSLRPPDRVPLSGGIVDISNGGMRVQTEELGLKEGVMLKVWIPLSETEVAVPVLTEVRWVKEEKTGGYHAGLRFMM